VNVLSYDLQSLKRKLTNRKLSSNTTLAGSARDVNELRVEMKTCHKLPVARAYGFGGRAAALATVLVAASLAISFFVPINVRRIYDTIK